MATLYDSASGSDDEEEQERQLSNQHGEAVESDPANNKKRNTDTGPDLDYSDVKKRRIVRPKVTAEQLLGVNGLIRIPVDAAAALRKCAPNAASAARYTRSLMQWYTQFAQDLCPGLAPPDVWYQMESKWGSKKEIKAYLQQMRDQQRNRHVEGVLGRETADRLLYELEEGLRAAQEDVEVDRQDIAINEETTASPAPEAPVESATHNRPAHSAVTRLGRRAIIDDSDDEGELEFESATSAEPKITTTNPAVTASNPYRVTTPSAGDAASASPNVQQPSVTNPVTPAAANNENDNSTPAQAGPDGLDSANMQEAIPGPMANNQHRPTDAGVSLAEGTTRQGPETPARGNNDETIFSPMVMNDQHKLNDPTASPKAMSRPRAPSSGNDKETTSTSMPTDQHDSPAVCAAGVPANKEPEDHSSNNHTRNAPESEATTITQQDASTTAQLASIGPSEDTDRAVSETVALEPNDGAEKVSH